MRGRQGIDKGGEGMCVCVNEVEGMQEVRKVEMRVLHKRLFVAELNGRWAGGVALK